MKVKQKNAIEINVLNHVVKRIKLSYKLTPILEDITITVEKFVLSLLVITIEEPQIMNTVLIVLMICTWIVLMTDAGMIVILKDYLLCRIMDLFKVLITGTIGTTMSQ